MLAFSAAGRQWLAHPNFICRVRRRRTLVARLLTPRSIFSETRQRDGPPIRFWRSVMWIDVVGYGILSMIETHGAVTAYVDGNKTESMHYAACALCYMMMAVGKLPM